MVLEGVNKSFGTLHVLRDIDLTVGRGEVVVVIGPSGSCKSTLVAALIGELRKAGRAVAVIAVDPS